MSWTIVSPNLELPCSPPSADFDDLRPNHAPVLAEVSHRDLVTLAFARDEFAVQLEHLREIVRMRVLGEVHRGEFVLGVPEHFHVRAVSGVEARIGRAADPTSCRLIEGTPGDANWRFLEHCAEALLALAEGFLGFLALRNVHEEALDIQRSALVILDDDGVVPQPDRPSVASDQPVLERPARVAGGEEPIVVSEDPLAIVGVEELEEEIGIAKPLVR